MAFLAAILIVALIVLYLGLVMEFAYWVSQKIGGGLVYYLISLTLTIGVFFGLIAQFGVNP